MLFGIKTETFQQDTKASLQTNREDRPPILRRQELNPYGKNRTYSPIRCYLNYSPKASRFAPCGMKASMTLEASLSFTCFLFFMVNVFSLIFLFIQYGERLEKLQQKGKELAIYAYAAQGVAGEGDEMIYLREAEAVDSPFPILAAPRALLTVQCAVRSWTGYDVTNQGKRGREEEVVYMTNYGEVYHRSRNCTHLALSIKVSPLSLLEKERNQAGARYKPCEYCGAAGFSALVYLTEQGNRYHSTLGCQGLKRTVKGVYLSQIPQVPACHKCGK